VHCLRSFQDPAHRGTIHLHKSGVPAIGHESTPRPRLEESLFGGMRPLTIVSREVASDAMAASAITFSGNLLSIGNLLPSSTILFPQRSSKAVINNSMLSPCCKTGPGIVNHSRISRPKPQHFGRGGGSWPKLPAEIDGISPLVP
jgi:hypothetical protein